MLAAGGATQVQPGADVAQRLGAERGSVELADAQGLHFEPQRQLQVRGFCQGLAARA